MHFQFREMNKKKTEANNVYDVHCEQKLATPHIRDRYTQVKRKKITIILQITNNENRKF